MHLASITIDADGSPSGRIAWYNHSTNMSKIRSLRPSLKNDRYGVQRMEMLAIYFALADNQRNIHRIAEGHRKRRVVVNIRSDSKTSVEQLQGISEVRDSVMRRICTSIRKLLDRMSYMIVFHHLERARNIAGLLLEQKKRREEERKIAHRYEKSAFSLMQANVPLSYGAATA